MLDREENIRQLTAAGLDVLVAGGGIVGAGIARDAALRGLRVGLVEQYDMAFGTSSRSTRLLHGGLRYLSQGNLKLVYESSHEKRIVHRIAPHLAQPMAFLFPAYRHSPWPYWQLRLGVKLYDLLCGGGNFQPSSGMSAGELLLRVPGINPYDLTGAVRYFDAMCNDARLVLDTLRCAAGQGALLGNYLRLAAAFPGKNGWDCRLHDTLSEKTYRLTARSVVNACGPWASTLSHSSVRLRLTKGIHLLIDRERLPVPEAVMVTEGKRTLFVIPWGRRNLLGSTDTDYNGPLDDVRTEAADVQYVLDVINGYFPEAKLTPGDVLSTYAGLRPLIDTGRGGPSDISRAHQILMPKPGWFDVAGGKLTTYRLIAEQTVDRLFKFLGRKSPPCRTAEEPLIKDSELKGESGILPPPVSRELVEHYCTREWAVHLDDVMIRRTNWHYYLDDPLQTAQQVAAWMAEICAWDAAKQGAELARYGELLKIAAACKSL
jgi:glycerol-3-phosphate dehydrogenase